MGVYDISLHSVSLSVHTAYLHLLARWYYVHNLEKRVKNFIVKNEEVGVLSWVVLKGLMKPLTNVR